MFTNQKVLGLILILLILGGGGYFVFNKFKEEVIQVTASPSPSPSPLSFIFNIPTPTPFQTSEQTQQKLQTQQGPQVVTPQPTPRSSERPLERDKKLPGFPGLLSDDNLKNKKVVMQTNKGIIQIQILPETKLASSNFMLLAANGFYDNLFFHRVEDWVVQGGDPLGNGTGGPGYQFNDEPISRPYERGTIAMANAGPNTNGSQFFILKKDYTLEPKYTIFGKVISGMDVVDNLTPGDLIQKAVVQVLQ